MAKGKSKKDNQTSAKTKNNKPSEKVAKKLTPVKAEVAKKAEKENAVRQEVRQEVKPVMESKTVESTTTSTDKVKTPSALLMSVIWLCVFVLSLAGIDLFFQYLNNDFSIAVVNGQRIPKSEYYTEMEKTAGSQIANKLIEDYLIRQEAQKLGITVEDSEINEVITQYEEYVGGKEVFEQELKDRNTTLDDVKKTLEVTLLAKKIYVKDLTVSDEELKALFDQYKTQLFAQEEDPQFEEKKEEVKKVYLDQKFAQERDSWLAGLRDNALVQNNYEAKPSYGLFQTVANIVNNTVNRGE